METKLIYQKIPKIMSLVGVVGKDRKNELQGYKFRGIDDMYNALNEHLASEKVFFTSEVLESSREERLTKNGGLLMYSILKMKFTAYAEDGSFVESTTIGEAMDTGDKSMNKAMSTAYKYALMQIFCIPTEEDKDTENQTHEIAWNNSPRTNETPTYATKWKQLVEYITEIKVENDTNVIKTLQDEAKKLFKSEKQIAWLNKEVEQRLQFLKSLPF